ncbi:hypothetical protein PT974_10647 [Cladobotryum mycophilum]|uniref:Uncharacterized protein n=1 Tax=Cladobotryum mycophilum TaxID=491253 RepID=A0ABR0SBE1_9HYPO
MLSAVIKIVPEGVAGACKDLHVAAERLMNGQEIRNWNQLVDAVHRGLASTTRNVRQDASQNTNQAQNRNQTRNSNQSQNNNQRWSSSRSQELTTQLMRENIGLQRRLRELAEGATTR